MSPVHVVECMTYQIWEVGGKTIPFPFIFIISSVTCTVTYTLNFDSITHDSLVFVLRYCQLVWMDVRIVGDGELYLLKSIEQQFQFLLILLVVASKAVPCATLNFDIYSYLLLMFQ